MDSLSEIIWAHHNPGHFIVWLFLGSHVDKWGARLLQIPCSGAPSSVYKWGSFYFGHYNLGYYNHLSVINQNDVIGSVKKCTHIMTTVLTSHAEIILLTALIDS